MNLVWGEALKAPRESPRTPYGNFAWFIAQNNGKAALYPQSFGSLSLKDSGDGVARLEAFPLTGLGGGDPFDTELLALPIMLPPRVVNPRLRHHERHAEFVTRADNEKGKETDATPDWLDPHGEPSVFVGIVDDAIGFANERFRIPPEAGGAPRTRIDYLWLQGAPFDDVEGSANLPFGREFRYADLKTHFENYFGKAGPLDEDGLYRDRKIAAIEMGQGDFQNGAMADTHGTAVLDQAAGFDPTDAAGRRVPILAVCLPPQATTDTLGTFAELFIIAAIERILLHVEHRAAKSQLGRYLPVVINISLALTGGPKDGTSRLDRYLDQCLQTWSTEERGELRFVFPAGNNRQSLTHARIGDQGDARRTFRWRLPPDDATPSFLEIWGPERDKPPTPSFRVGIAPPGERGAISVAAQTHDVYFDLKCDARTVGRLYVDWVLRASDEWRADFDSDRGRERITLAVMPTAGDDETVLAGDWTVMIWPMADPKWPLEVFVQRDDSIQGFRRRGRQSTIIDPRYVPRHPEGRVKATDGADGALLLRAGTISSFACGDNVTVAGSRFVALDLDSPYSGLPIEAGRPVITRMPVDRSRLRFGIRTAASHSGGRRTIAGTSIAAACLTRLTVYELGGPAPPPEADPLWPANRA